MNTRVENTTNQLHNTIERAKAGDKQSFELLYLELYQPLFRFVLFKTRDNEKTEDIVQDVFMRWYQSLSTYKPEIKPLNYLITIAMRLIINDAKKKKAIPYENDMDEDFAANNEPVESFLNTKMEFEKVKEIIDTELTENEKNVITLKYINDFNNEECAGILDKTQGNIRVIEYRGLKRIRDIYNKKHGTQGQPN